MFLVQFQLYRLNVYNFTHRGYTHTARAPAEFTGPAEKLAGLFVHTEPFNIFALYTLN